MFGFRHSLPQLGGELTLTDGGLETTLIFHQGIDLPDFAAFDLLRRPGGEEVLRSYYEQYVEIAKRHGVAVILESASWRANPDWGTRLGYSREQLAEANRQSVQLLQELRWEHETGRTKIVVSGCMGPRGDGYVPTSAMTAKAAETYHLEQALALASAGADMLAALTINYVEEAVGIARVARRIGIPVAISFTVETDGNLPTGQSLGSAIEQVDAATGRYPVYYMINCAHPSHFAHVLEEGARWLGRIRGVRANASRRSHAELNESTELDEGNPDELARECAELRRRFPRLNVMGGCCGTDARHVERIAEACTSLSPVPA